jgi:DNA-binding response OmpR family regulator
VRPGASSERAVILAPTGRDASVAAALIKEAGFYANVCGDLAALLHEIEGGAGLAVIADEAIKTADLRGLVRWLNDQPSWSDFPIVLLTHQGGGPERNPDAVRLGQALGNVTFIERPFHPTTLVSVVGSAVRGRRRQYQTLAILEDLTESEGLLQTALNAGRLGTLELRPPELELEASDTCKAFSASRAIRFRIRICWRRFIRMTARDVARYWTMLSKRAGTTASSTAISGPTDRSIGSMCARGPFAVPMAASNRWSVFPQISPRARFPRSNATICWLSWPPSVPRWRS